MRAHPERLARQRINKSTWHGSSAWEELELLYKIGCNFLNPQYFFTIQKLTCNQRHGAYGCIETLGTVLNDNFLCSRNRTIGLLYACSLGQMKLLYP